jgi:hypothetical protein
MLIEVRIKPPVCLASDLLIQVHLDLEGAKLVLLEEKVEVSIYIYVFI